MDMWPIARSGGACTPRLLTVNIDNGYGAACAALRSLSYAEPAEIPPSIGNTPPVQ